GFTGTLLRRPFSAFLRDQLRRLLQRYILHRIFTPQADVVLTVGDVRAEPAILNDQRFTSLRIFSQLPQRRRSRPPARRLGLREQRQRLFQGDGEQLLVPFQGTRLVSLTQIRTVPTGSGHDL